MSNSNMSNFMKQKFSLCPANGRQAVGDGAFTTDITPSVLAVCQMQGTDDMYYYSTTFSGGPGVGVLSPYSQFSSSPPEKLAHSFIRSSTAPYRTVVGPRDIPCRSDSPYDVATPPLTPDDDEGSDASSGISIEQSKDALDFLLNIFPRDGLSVLPFAKSVTVSAPNMGVAFDGVVVELPGKSKTLYVDGKNAEAVSLRESIVALLDLADDQLQCSALVIALDKTSGALSELLHSLMYVGGNVVTKPPFQVDPAYLLVGLEI
ncbi:hypothetical protein BV22DRAFT_1104119 [Leucogyrophana mollusca]|uniref:Uncharacterized protein n=1 Tax=Leucogyrophana mollusca TaxID=85980 RepID=A0ACB8BND5_9AGAM|nr:hypothetical protein BV22DRAFT_1104119 [Leucogyrophana mollusca]